MINCSMWCVMSALQSPIEYQKEQSAVTATLRKTNSQPASMMQSTLCRPTAHSHYTRMTSDPQAKVKAAEKVKGHDAKVQRSGSPQQTKQKMFSGLRSSLSRLSKSPSHEDLTQQTTTTTTTTTTAAAATTTPADTTTTATTDGDVGADVKVNSQVTSVQSDADDSYQHQQPVTGRDSCTPDITAGN